MMGSGDGVGDDGDEDSDDGVDDSFNLLASIRVPQFVGLNEGNSLSWANWGQRIEANELRPTHWWWWRRRWSKQRWGGWWWYGDDDAADCGDDDADDDNDDAEDGNDSDGDDGKDGGNVGRERDAEYLSCLISINVALCLLFRRSAAAVGSALSVVGFCLVDGRAVRPALPGDICAATICHHSDSYGTRRR